MKTQQEFEAYLDNYMISRFGATTGNGYVRQAFIDGYNFDKSYEEAPQKPTTMTLNQLTKQSTETVTDYIAFVEFKGQEIPFKVTHTVRICSKGTSFTSVDCRQIAAWDGLPNLTKGQKTKIREMISKDLEN